MKMIKIRDYLGKTQIINTNEISHISQCGASAAWHGINTIIKMNNGSTIECQDSISDIENMIFE